MRKLSKGLVAATLLLFGATACADLEVTNLNAPDASRALQSAGDVESLIAGGFETWHDAQYTYTGPALFLSNQSFQHTAPWANASMEFYGRIPRNPIVNDPAHVEYAYWTSPWDINYGAISGVADGLRAIENAESGVADDLGADRTARAKAFGNFVLGMALLYDQGFIIDETTDLTQPQDPVDYTAMMTAALGYLDKAITEAQAGFTDIPATWMSVAVSSDELIRLAHSQKARFMANVARDPTERAAVNWGAVVDEVDAGITEDWVMDMDPNNGWYADALDYGTYPGWAQANYFVMGMADQSGAYQYWLNLLPTGSAKLPNPGGGPGDGGNVLIVTPDTRFVQGTTLAEQLDSTNAGSLFQIPDALPNGDDQWGIANVWKRPDRGTWRWSWYWHVDSEQYTYWNDFDWPEVTKAEMDLLKAEAYMNGAKGMGAADAAAIVNTYRTANGLSATDAAGTNTECVPKLPNGTCGDLMEMLKWEKRMETHFKGIYMNSWWFDGRGWGDLFKGTPLQFPIPCLEAQTLGLLPCYTFGGAGGDYAAPVSNYAYPDETS
ncbi:MAG: hypothetical protein P8Z36_17520 [Gemmatimonadota bacterium]